MGFLPPRKICLIFLIISASIISTSFAGRKSRFMSESSPEEFVGAYEESPYEGEEKDENIAVHERMLRRMNTNDYGRYNPSPRFARPRHKLIPN